MLDVNLNKVVEKLKGKELQLPDLPSSKSSYQELEDFMLNSEAIQNIIKQKNLDSDKGMDEIINSLSDENIFAVKFLQIKIKVYYQVNITNMKNFRSPKRKLPANKNN